MATKKNTPLSVEALRHAATTRKNIPTAEYQPVVRRPRRTRCAWPARRVPGTNNLGTHGRRACAEFSEVHRFEADFKARVQSRFNNIIGSVAPTPPLGSPPSGTSVS